MIREILFDINNLNKTLLESKGVYKITNKINGNFYIGSTIRSFKDRFKEHCGKFMLFLNRESFLNKENKLSYIMKIILLFNVTDF